MKVKKMNNFTYELIKLDVETNMTFFQRLINYFSCGNYVFKLINKKIKNIPTNTIKRKRKA